MRREAILRPGYDCITNPCGKDGCGTNPGNSHGQHCDDWIFAVCEGDAALSLTVFSGAYPRGKRQEPAGADMSMHTAFPHQEDDVRQPGTGHACEFVEGGRCWTAWTGCLMARDLFKEFGVPTFEQPETFWLAMEKRFREARAELEPERTVQCAHCAGKGTLPLKATP